MDVTPPPTDLQEAMKLIDELRHLVVSQQHDHAALLETTQTLIADRDRLQQRLDELQATNKRLTDMLWGRRSERRPDSPGQSLLSFLEEEAREETAQESAVITAPQDEQEVVDAELIRQWKARRQSRRTRRRTEEFPAHLERRDRLFDLSDEDKAGLKYIGDAVTERMCFENPKVYIDRIIRRKYVKEGEPQAGVQAPPPPLAIVEGCKYDFSLIAAILAMKYAFHQPTYRQQDYFAQSGWFPSRSTINELLNVSVETIPPVMAQMRQLLLRQSVLHIDETRVLLLTRDSLTAEQHAQLRKRRAARRGENEDDQAEKEHPGSVTSYAWLITGQDSAAPYNWFHWSLTRQPSTIDALLQTYLGTVVADAYDAYARIEQRSAGRIHFASCNAHARREFVLAETYEPILCSQIRSLYGQLYAIEERGKLMSASARQELRQKEAVPVWQRIHDWLHSDAVTRAALPRSRFGKAVGYLKNQWEALRRYLGDGALPIDNNLAEQTIRPLTVSRKNWLFLGHPAAAAGRMDLLSLVSSAHRHHLKVQDYLEDVLRKLADARQHHPPDLQLDSPYLLDLLPDRWAAAHPQSIRQERVLEQQSIADHKRARRAFKRQRARQAKRA